MKGLPARGVAPESAALIRLSDFATAYLALLVAAGVVGLLVDVGSPAVEPASGTIPDAATQTKIEGARDATSRGSALFWTGALGAAMSVPFMRRAQREGRIGWLSTALGAVQIFLVAALVFVVMAVLLALFLSADPSPGRMLLPGLTMILYGAPVVFLLGLVFWTALRLRCPPAFAETADLRDDPQGWPPAS